MRASPRRPAYPTREHHLHACATRDGRGTSTHHRARRIVPRSPNSVHRVVHPECRVRTDASTLSPAVYSSHAPMSVATRGRIIASSVLATRRALSPYAASRRAQSTTVSTHAHPCSFSFPFLLSPSVSLSRSLHPARRRVLGSTMDSASTRARKYGSSAHPCEY